MCTYMVGYREPNLDLSKSSPRKKGAQSTFNKPQNKNLISLESHFYFRIVEMRLKDLHRLELPPTADMHVHLRQGEVCGISSQVHPVSFELTSCRS